MKNLIVSTIAGLSVMLATLQSEARLFRAREMDAKSWGDALKNAKPGDVVEFRQGDELPVTLRAEGDLLETRNPETTYVSVKRNFWLKMSANSVLVSLDGQNFGEIKDRLEGQLSASANANDNGEPASALNILFSARVKGAK